MSVVNEERNELMKRFGDKAVILIEDELYSTSLLQPNARNKRLFPVHAQAVERLNSTMQRHIDGNSQIFVTMVYKDVPREDLIVKFWNGLQATESFQNLPQELKDLELQQAQKLGPTSRFNIERLYDGFISHIDEESKIRNIHLDEYRIAANYLAKYIAECCKEALVKYPDEAKPILDKFYDLPKAFERLPKDKAGGDPYFIRTDRKISGASANDLYFKDSKKVRQYVNSEVYYTMYSRIQNKGNNIIKDFGNATLPSGDYWLPEKNRVVQGDSRSWQFLLKNISDVITQLPKMVDPIFCGWLNQEEKNELFSNTLKEFRGEYLFDSFDATEYDGTTDPENFALGIRIIYQVCRELGLNPDSIVDEELVIRHYLNDPTLTPWGAFLRDSTPSGHNFTGPNGTMVNLLRCFVQTARLFGCSFRELIDKLREARAKRVVLFAAVGDDAFALRSLNRTKEDIAEENNSDGFKQGDPSKLVLSPNYLHFLQFAYMVDDNDNYYLGYYPVCRMAEHGLFQERADQYTAESISSVGLVQNINNCRFNPCQDYAIKFFMEGDVKYRLGSKIGVMNLFKLASGGRPVAETLGREWDPSYTNMTWGQYSEVLSETIKKIEREGENFS